MAIIEPIYEIEGGLARGAVEGLWRWRGVMDAQAF